MDGQNLTKFWIHFIIDKIYVCIVNCHFSQICNRVTALDWCQKFFLLNILRMDGQNLTKFCIHIIINKIYVGKVKRHFFANLQWSYGPWLMSEIVFLLNSLNECTESNQILYIHYHWHDLSTISSSNRDVLLNISLSSDRAMAGLWSDPLTIPVFCR